MYLYSYCINTCYYISNRGVGFTMSIWFIIFDTSIIWGYLGSLNGQLWGCQVVYLKIPYSSGGLGDKKGTSCMRSWGGGGIQKMCSHIGQPIKLHCQVHWNPLGIFWHIITNIIYVELQFLSIWPWLFWCKHVLHLSQWTKHFFLMLTFTFSLIMCPLCISYIAQWGPTKVNKKGTSCTLGTSSKWLHTSIKSNFVLLCISCFITAQQYSKPLREGTRLWINLT